MRYRNVKQTIMLAVCGLAMGSAYAAPIRTIQQAVTQAIATNPDYIASQDNYQISKYQVNEARSGYFPKVDLAYSYGREASETPSLRSQGIDHYYYLNRREDSVQVSELLFDGGGTISQVEEANKNEEQALEVTNSDQQSLILNTITTYLEINRFRALLKLSYDNVALHKKNCESGEKKVSSVCGS